MGFGVVRCDPAPAVHPLRITSPSVTVATASAISCLHVRNIFQLAIERLRPELDPVGRVHQFGYDRTRSPCLRTVPSKSVLTPSFSPMLSVLLSVLETERRTATNDFEPADLSESCNQFFRQSI